MGLSQRGGTTVGPVGDPRPDPRTVPLCGRTPELAWLLGLVNDVQAGRGRIALVAGEAGIGKSRVVGTVLEEAATRGLQVQRGAAHELEHGHPFGVFVDALDLTSDSVDPQRATIGQILSSPVVPVPGTPLVDVGFGITEAILGLLQTLAARGPVVLAMEDLHWADVSSLGVLGAVGRRLTDLPLLVIATFRPPPPASELARLVDALILQHAAHLELGALDHSAVVELVSLLIGARPGTRLLEGVAGAAGNPLFVAELVQALVDDGVIAIDDGIADAREIALPRNLRLTILRRLSSLPRETVELLRICSVLGSPFPVAELAAVHGTSGVALLPVLDDAFRANMLEPAGEGLAFRHDLIRAAIYEDMPEAVRLQLHREAGRALADIGAPTVRVAEHVALGAQPGDDEAVAWLRRAALEVVPQSPAIAVDLLERALELAHRKHSEQGQIGAELAPLLVLTGRGVEAERLTHDVLEHDPPPAVEVQLRLGLAHALARQGRWRAAREQLGRAADSVPEPLRTMMFGPGFLAIALGDAEVAAEQAARARALAEQHGNAVALTTALTTLAGAADAHGDVREAVRLGREAVAAGAHAEPTFAGLLVPELLLGAVLTDADEPDEGVATLQAGLERAHRSGSVSQLPYYHAALAGRHLLIGDWDDALTEAATCRTLERETGTRWPLGPAAVTARILIARDDLAGAARTLDDADAALADTDLVIGGDWMLWARALLIEAEGADPATVSAAMTRAWDALPELRFLFGNRAMAIDVVRAALAAGEREAAVGITEQLEEVARRAGVASALGAAQRCRGLLDADLGSLLASVESYRQSPREVERAWAAEDAATGLARAGRADEARPLFEEALASYGRVGATRDVGRAVATMRSVGLRRGSRGRRRRPSHGWAALTPTERRVAGLVAEGLTNPQVAERLFVSRHTVESHLKHIFVKLALSSRTELAVEVARRNPGMDPA